MKNITQVYFFRFVSLIESRYWNGNNYNTIMFNLLTSDYRVLHSSGDSPLYNQLLYNQTSFGEESPRIEKSQA